MAADQDTEITLGTGKLLVLFFGLVAVCAVFFGMGFSMGKASAKAPGPADPVPSTSSKNTAVRPSAVKPASAPADLTFYKTVEQKNADPQLASSEDTNKGGTAPATASQEVPDPTLAAPPAGYYVQVAAVSKQEDADALVDALKKKQYPAFANANAASDKLFHVQVGPFGDIKDAEVTRAKLVGDGYNPILKK